MTREDSTPHLERYATYEEACREYRAAIPRQFNIAETVCRRHADAVTRIDLIEVRPAANNIYTAGALDYFSDKFATVLANSGIVHGDRIAVMLAQSAALIVAHLGALKLGAVVVPLSAGADSEQNEFILKHTAARALVIEEAHRGDAAIKEDESRAVFVVSDAVHSHVVAGSDRSFWREVYEASSDFRIAETPASTPALIFWVLDGKDAPRYIVHTHAALIDSLAAFEMANDFELGDNVVFWTPGGWASIGSLFGMIYPALYYGIPIVAGEEMDFDGNRSLEIMESCEVTTAVLEAGQLQAWKSNHPNPRDRFDLKLQRVIVTDSGLTQEMIDWVTTDLKASLQADLINIETGPLVATCDRWFERKDGTLGRPVPGRMVEILDSNGSVVPPGFRGRLAIRLADRIVRTPRNVLPGMTAASPGDWFVTEQVGIKDEDGNVLMVI